MRDLGERPAWFLVHLGEPGRVEFGYATARVGEPGWDRLGCSPRSSYGIMDDVSTQTLPEVDTRPEGTDATGNDTPKMFHYVKKAKITESAVLGNMVVALCGEKFPVTRSPKPGSPVCLDCKKIFESLPPGGDA